MGRPSKSEERREQILDAFERIILKEGFAKASQRKIAEEAKMNQPIIHHYFAGRDEMLDAFLTRVINRYSSALDIFIQEQHSPSLEQIIKFVCSEKFHKISMQNEVFFSLIGQGGYQDRIFQKLTSVYDRFFTEIKKYLDDAAVENSEHASYMLMCFVIGHDWAKKLGFGEQRNDQVAADLLRLTGNH
jgi:AcrR family transcriptional regulator